MHYTFAAMGIIKILFQLFLIYMLYKFVFNLVIPLYKASQQMRKKMNEMNSRMQQQEMNQRAQAQQPTPSTPKINKEDYIDYEEIK